MPIYIAKFLDKGIRLLLQNKGQEFLNEYYAYISKIYNYQIPLKDIATKGKVKKTIEDYIKDCQEITKAGRPKSRQAWMELAIKNNIHVDMGETLYYINTGKSKSQADVKKNKKYVRKVKDIFSVSEEDCSNWLMKEWKTAKASYPEGTTMDEYVSKKYPDIEIVDEIILNCQLLPREVVDSETDVFCSDNEEYNVPKYIDMFNKRITPLLVCFSREIRDRILINNPSERPYFTEEESMLVSGQPNKESDQDTYEQLMTMEDKEIRFWMRHPEWEVPFAKECGMDIDEIFADYKRREEREKQLGIDKVREQFFNAIEKLNSEDMDRFYEGVLPESLKKIVDVDPITGNFVSKNYPDITIGTIYDILERNGDRLSEDSIQEVEY